METKTLPRYHSSQEELYTIAEIGWDSCLERLPDFQKHKAKYTETYIQAKLAAIPEARNLGTSQARAATSEMAHNPLKELAEDCLTMHFSLDSYIDDAYAEADRKAAHEAAGSAYYKKASNDNWMSLRNLNSAGILFTNTNKSTLSMGGQNMPDSFPQQYTEAAAKFDDQYMSFIKKDGQNPGNTSAKITANNAIYTDLLSMFGDAAAIYRRNDTIKSQFAYDDILHRITGEQKTGIRIEAIEAITELPVAGLSVTAQPGNKSADTAENGVTEIGLTEDDYTLTIKVPSGYQPIPPQSVKTNTGIMHRKKFILQKL